jgi:hypothetical protein
MCLKVAPPNVLTRTNVIPPNTNVIISASMRWEVIVVIAEKVLKRIQRMSTSASTSTNVQQESTTVTRRLRCAAMNKAPTFVRTSVLDCVTTTALRPIMDILARVIKDT